MVYNVSIHTGYTMTQDMKRTNLIMPVDLFRKARGRAISEGSHLSGVVTMLLEAWLAGEIELPTPAQGPAPKKKRRNTTE